MKQSDFMEVMAAWGDAEAHSTAALVEMIAAAALLKLNPPASGIDVVSVEIEQADLDAINRDFKYEARYEDGRMQIILTPLAIPFDVDSSFDFMGPTG